MRAEGVIVSSVLTYSVTRLFDFLFIVLRLVMRGRCAGVFEFAVVDCNKWNFRQSTKSYLGEFWFLFLQSCVLKQKELTYYVLHVHCRNLRYHTDDKQSHNDLRGE